MSLEHRTIQKLGRINDGEPFQQSTVALTEEKRPGARRKHLAQTSMRHTHNFNRRATL